MVNDNSSQARHDFWRNSVGVQFSWSLVNTLK